MDFPPLKAMKKHKAPPPLLELINVTHCFSTKDQEVAVLKRINLKVYAGEMIAIIGASGSGKSTLMHILGCLDSPTQGEYRINASNVADLEIDALAHLRRERFGFIFQRYHLLPYLSAQENVEMPAVYAGIGSTKRSTRAQTLLQRLGLEAYAQYQPNQLSGGQQQRVSIARALINGGEIILADEPTGALDSQSGQAVMHILHELHALGHTIILVTHNEHIAAEASRVIEICDGTIVRDETQTPAPPSAITQSDISPHTSSAKPPFFDGRRFIQTCKIAWASLYSHRLRTLLTLLGIMIGIASVVSSTGINEGTKSSVLKEVRNLGPHTIHIFRGRTWGDRQAKRIYTLREGDITALRAQPYIDSITPNIRRSQLVRYRNLDVMAIIHGVGESYFQVRGISIEKGRAFASNEVRQQAQTIVIDANTQSRFFSGTHDPIGQILLINNLPNRVIGVTTPKKKELSSSGDGDLNIWMPYTTASAKLFRQYHFDSITVRLREEYPSETAERNITALLKKRHGTQDFFTYNLDTILKTAESINRSLTLLLSCITAISLIVGGIGVMNIMLVSVSERTREIGIRMAVGARRTDILRQFLVEAIMICLIGGVLGILFSIGLRYTLPLWIPQWKMVLSSNTMALACLSCALIGVVFGFIPAYNASRLNPAQALTQD
jgi:macrolide transport system ATP-binding/permease protein